jgi:hypothetical protein
VYNRISAIIGAHPNRSELVSLVTVFGWVHLSRDEKRVKARLILRLEEFRDQLLPFLETQIGIDALQTAYQPLLEKRARSFRRRAGRELPPEAKIEFYLNKHEEQFM